MGAMVRGLVAAGVIAVVVLAIVLSSGSNATQNPNNGKPLKADGTAALAPAKMILECEETTTIDSKTPDGKEVLRVRTQSEGKAISFLEMPEEWIKECGFETTLKGKPEQLPGRATWEFEAPRDDTYFLNLRARWADECGDSVYVKIDGGEWYSLEDSLGMIGKGNYRWAWHQLMVGGKPKGFELKQGNHTLYLGTREDGPCLDQWVLTTDAGVPVGEAAKK